MIIKFMPPSESKRSEMMNGSHYIVKLLWLYLVVVLHVAVSELLLGGFRI